MIKKMYLFSAMLVVLTIGAWAQAPVIRWQKAVAMDTPYMKPEGDGGFPSTVNASVSVHQIIPVKGGNFILFDGGGIIKLNAVGDTMFKKSISFSVGETSNKRGSYMPMQVMATPDSGFVVVGQAQAWDYSWPEEWHDVYLSKYDQDANLMWREKYTTGLFPYYADGIEPYGDVINDPVYRKRYALTQARSVTPTTDGGYLLLVQTNAQSGGDKSEDTKDVATPMLWHNGDYWVIKTDATGLVEWDKTIGGTGTDNPFGAINTPDGGYILAGMSYSPASGDKSQGRKGGDELNNDFWLVKIDAIGNVVWDKTIGTSDQFDQITCFKGTADGGFVVGGITRAGIDGDKTDTAFGDQDIWLLKLDGNANIQWQKTLGGNQREGIRSAYLQADGNLIIGANSNSPVSGNKTVAAPGGYWVEAEYIDFGDGTGFWTDRYYQPAQGDYWVFKLSASGNIVWQTTLGGTESESLGEVLPVEDGIMVFGSSYSGITGNRTEVNTTIKTLEVIIDGNTYPVPVAGSDLWMLVLGEVNLPVSLISFTGHLKTSDKALLEWKSATEENFSHFELEKSTNLQSYSKVANVAAKGNNSSYAYTDNIGSGTTYYRLKMVDKDGSVKYSNIVAITSAGYAAVTIAPNPVAAGAMLTMTLPPAPKNAYLQIIGIDGKMYGSKPVPEGALQLKLDTKALAKGNYVLVYTHDGKRDVIRFIKN